VRVTTTASGTQISGAIIGLSATGLTRLDNLFGGVALLDDSTGSTVGPGNYISGNTGPGITLKLSSGSYTSVSATTITGNFIGLDTALSGAIGNTGPGIDVQAGSSGTLIGGSVATANYLAGNGGAAIQIAGASTSATTVSNNTIGLAKDIGGAYNVAKGNTGDGVAVSAGARGTTIDSNIIASSGGAGVRISGSDTMTATLSANKIGWVLAGSATLDRANAGGIIIDQASYITAQSNLLAYNSGNAITASGVHTVTLQSNQIFLHTSGSAVEVNGASSNVQLLSNSLQQNRDYGVFVRDTSQRVRIQSNKISENGLGGVKLEGTTRYLGSGPDDAASLPNHGIDPPIFDPTFANPLSLRVTQNGAFSGRFYTDTVALPASACGPANACQIQFFQPNPDPAKTPDGQGFLPYQVFLEGGSSPVDFATPQPDGSGRFSGQLDLKGGLLPRQLIFAITDADGNTSEFGALDLKPLISLIYLSPPGGAQFAAPGELITYTLRLTNTGSLDLENASFRTSGSLAGWAINPPNPTTTLFSLPAQQGRTFTVTMALPTSSDSNLTYRNNVLAGTIDHTSVTVAASGNISPLSLSRILTTTVRELPVVVASTPIDTGHAPPNGTVTHTHAFQNSGNVTVTLDLVGKTLDPAGSSLWDPVLSVSVLEIPPGQTKTVDAVITVPAGAQAYDAQGLPFQVTTLVTATARAPYASIIKQVSGVTTVDLVPRAQVTVNSGATPAVAFADVSFFHNIFNQSNGRARFCLNSQVNSGSSVVSYSSQNGVEIVDNCFTLEAPVNNDPASLLRLKVVVRVTGTLLPGRLDFIRTYLTDARNGQEIPNAAAVDSVEITASPMLPAVWIPLVVR
jgi:hypothetical protein